MAPRDKLSGSPLRGSKVLLSCMKFYADSSLKYASSNLNLKCNSRFEEYLIGVSEFKVFFLGRLLSRSIAIS